MKAIEQYFHVVLFIMLCKVVLTFLLSEDPCIQIKAIDHTCFHKYVLALSEVESDNWWRYRMVE